MKRKIRLVPSYEGWYWYGGTYISTYNEQGEQYSILFVDCKLHTHPALHPPPYSYEERRCHLS